MTAECRIHINEKYEPLFNDCPARFFVVTGGRGSGKSFGVGTAAVNRLMQDEHQRILYTRLTLVSAGTSIIPEFTEKIELLGAGGDFAIQKSENTITHLPSGNCVWFKGLKTSDGDQTAKLKSLQGVTTWILDEAEELVDEEIFDKIALSVRDKRTQNRIILILNPAHTDHWIYKRFFKDAGVAYDFNGVKGNVCYIHTSYLDNIDNLAADYVAELEAMKVKNPDKYRHIVMGEWVDDYAGALWRREWIKQNRVLLLPDLDRIVIGVDPNVSSGDSSDECGIIVAGKKYGEKRIYTLEDASIKGTPAEWAAATARMWNKWQADCVVAEVNQGGDLVETNLKNLYAYINVCKVHAWKGKAARAEPVAGLAQEGLDCHVGILPELENELCQWIPESGQRSPNRLDAKVYAAHKLMDNPEITKKTISGMY